jgi:uncharacterized protein with NRDE domain
MCLIALAWGASERFPFVVAANRDEFYERPTAPLATWTTPRGTSIIGGRDLRDGGTWMAFATNGRFAMLTNVRQPRQDGALGDTAPRVSRGGLVLAWLESDLAADQWAQRIEPQLYQGFNLIVGDWPSRQCHYLTNQIIFKTFVPIAKAGCAQSAIELVAKSMPFGFVYGLSNAALDTPWPKTRTLKQALLGALASGETTQLAQSCFGALADPHSFAAHELPATGVSAELERALASVFVRHPATNPQYGTRTSLVAVYEVGHGLRVTEITHPTGGAAARIGTSHTAWP